MFWKNKRGQSLCAAGAAAYDTESVEQPEPAPCAYAALAARVGDDGTLTAQNFPDMLIAHAKVAFDQMKCALETQRLSGGFLGDILVEQGALDEDSLVAFLAKHCKIPYLSLLNYSIDKAALDLVPSELCVHCRVIPVDRMGTNLTVAMVNPLDAEALNSLQEQCSGLRIKPILCAKSHFDSVARRLFGGWAAPGESDPAIAENGAEKAEAHVSASDVKGVEFSCDEFNFAVHDTERLPEGTLIEPEENLPPAGFLEVGTDRPTWKWERRRGDGLSHRRPDSTISVHGAAGCGIETPLEGSPYSDLNNGKSASIEAKSMQSTYRVLARRIRLFRGLEPETVANLFARGSSVECDAGEVIYVKGELGHCMYVVLDGTVELFDEGRTVETLRQGENFGEMALMGQRQRSECAKATAPASLLMLDYDDLTREFDKTVSVQLLVNITLGLGEKLRLALSL